MLSRGEYVSLTLDLNLFFLRIMKEHSLFLALGFTPRDKRYTDEANMFRMNIERLLAEAVNLAEGAVSREAANSGEFVTQYTPEAERLTQFYTSVPIDSRITQKEAQLGSGMRPAPSSMLEQRVDNLNRRALDMVSRLAEFKQRILSNVLGCGMFTGNYPLLIDHILREARFYMRMLEMLLSREDILEPQELISQEAFWNRIMAEHAKFIAGLLDPSEETLIDTARMFGKEFDTLTAEAAAAARTNIPEPKVTQDSMNATGRIRDFKAAGTEGLIACKIKSIIVPLLADHTLREANHYLRILGMARPQPMQGMPPKGYDAYGQDSGYRGYPWENPPSRPPMY